MLGKVERNITLRIKRMTFVRTASMKQTNGEVKREENKMNIKGNKVRKIVQKYKSTELKT